MHAQKKLRVGELVVHPVYGFCRIQRIGWSRSGDRDEECYVFVMGSATNPVKVSVPVAQAASAGLRRPITKEQADAVLQVFEATSQPLGPTSREQLEVISARLGSGDVFEVAAMIRDLVASGVDEGSGPSNAAFVNRRRSERIMLENALERLVDEVARVQHLPRKQVEARIQMCLKRKRKVRTTQALAT